jgi:hypothetical protein
MMAHYPPTPFSMKGVTKVQPLRDFRVDTASPWGGQAEAL